MRRKHPKCLIIIAILTFIFTFTNNLWANEVLTWNDCIRETLTNNPDLVSAQAQLEQTVADKDITQSTALPQINTNLTANKSKVTGNDTIETYSYSISGKQLLFDGNKTSNAIKNARENITAEQYNYLVTSSNIRENLKTKFAELLRAQELISLTKAIAERREQNLKLIELRYEAGREHKGSLLTAQADLANAEFEVKQALRTLSLTQTEMIKAIGWQHIEPIEVSGNFLVNNLETKKPDFESLADMTPLLKALISKKDASQFNLNSKKSDFLPELYLNSSAGQNGSDWPVDNNEWMFGLSISFPLFEGGNRIAQVSKAQAQLTQAAAVEQSGRNSVLITLEQTWALFQDTFEIVSVQEKFVQAAEERAKIAKAQYSSGLITFDDWIIIEDNLVDAKKSYLNAQANVLIAQAQWVQAKGGVLENEN